MSTDRKTILIVEDERPLMEAIQATLEKNGYDTLCARTVDQAIDYLKKVATVDAVWLDHYLPGKNGTELVAYMKVEDSAYKHTPIFLVSNTASPEKVYNYLQLGVDKYFVKAEKRLDDIIKDITGLLAAEE